MSNPPPLVDIPFEHRHTCWFCAEPCNATFSYWRMPHTPHPSLTVPACQECKLLAKKHQLTSIWDCKEAVRDALTLKYQKHLAIGINWTEEELAESEFDCKIFGGFKKSAWMMYEIAKKRVNAKGWQLSLDGVVLENDPFENTAYLAFEFDGLSFSHVSKAIRHYSQAMGLDEAFLTQLVTLLGKQRFSHAIKLARLNNGVTRGRQAVILQEIQQDIDAGQL